jgi:hypothetical protein
MKQTATVFAQYPRPVLVDVKAPATGFGYRFDLNSWDPREPSYPWFPWDGTDSGTGASAEDIFRILGATGNAEFILNLPTPRYLIGNPNTQPEGSGYGYLWQTPQFYAAMAQYLFGTAGPSSEWQGLPTTLDFFLQPASFNWADLRARRGRVSPYPVVAIIIGEEPYYIEGWNAEGSAWGAYAEQFRVALRNRGITGPLGLHVREVGAVDDASRPWFGPMMNSLTYGDFEYIDLHHYYQFSTQPEVFKRTYPVTIDPAGFQNWWLSPSTWPSDYSRFLWIVQDTRNAIRDFGFGDPSRWKLGWSEHGIQIVSQFQYNDMQAGLHWALWLAEAMRQNTVWDANWVLADTGFSHAQIQIRDGHITRTPGFFAYQMAQQFYGYDLLANTFSSTTGSVVADTSGGQTGVTLQFPWTVVRVFRDPATLRIHLFVVNQHPTNAATITGFENWGVVDWKQIHSAYYTDQNPIGNPWTPEPIQPTTVTAPPGQPLTIQPISINHIVLEGFGVTSVTPMNGPVAGGSAVTLGGVGFASGATVSFGGVAATGVTVVSSRQITAVTPAHAVGIVDVSVSVAAVGEDSLAQSYFYAPPPVPSSFYTVAPCRLADTRTTTPLAGGERRVFPVAGLCNVPLSARSVAVNITATGPTANGFLSPAPGDGLSSSSALNFRTGMTRASNTIILLATDGTGSVSIRNGSLGTTHVVLDVCGYFQ